MVQFSMNWFKPFYTFSNGSFISYQGYLDYKFGADKIADNGFNASNSGSTGSMVSTGTPTAILLVMV